MLNFISMFFVRLKNAGKKNSIISVSASPNCIVIQGFPTSDTLSDLEMSLERS